MYTRPSASQWLAQEVYQQQKPTTKQQLSQEPGTINNFLYNRERGGKGESGESGEWGEWREGEWGEGESRL